ncbi:MAG: MGMT family protein [Candidatus Hadarchaeales archaeon]
MSLKETVLELVRKIPVGKVTTYKEIALAAGKPNSWRAVAKILANNPAPIFIPCHRVIKSSGHLGGYVFGTEKKEELLRKEGVEISKGRVDLKRYMFYFKIHRRR